MSEYPVHDKGDTDHVAAVFKDGQEQEQERHLRCEAEDGAKSADHAIGYCADEHTVRVKSSQTVCHSLLYPGRRDIVDPVCEEAAHAVDGEIVDQEHDPGKDRDSEDPACNDLVNLVRGGQFLTGLLHGSLHHLLDKSIALIRDDGLHIGIFFLLDGSAFGGNDLELAVRQGKLCGDLRIILQHLDGIPSALLLWNGSWENHIHIFDSGFKLL